MYAVLNKWVLRILQYIVQLSLHVEFAISIIYTHHNAAALSENAYGFRLIQHSFLFNPTSKMTLHAHTHTHSPLGCHYSNIVYNSMRSDSFKNKTA